MLEDRPDMCVLGKEHPIYQWVVRGFAGDRIGQRVYWNANSPRSGQRAEHGAPYGPYPPYISVSGGTETTAIDKWAGVVFELFNLENHQAFASLISRGCNAELDGDQYARECLKLEFAALKKTEQFLREHPPSPKLDGTNPIYKWLSDGVGTLDEYLAGTKTSAIVPGHNNYGYYKQHFDTAIRPYAERALVKSGEGKKHGREE